MKKVDLVGIPAIGRSITLFKALHDPEEDKRRLEEKKKKKKKKDKTMAKENDATTLNEMVDDLDEEARAAFIKSLGIEPLDEDALVEKVLKGIGDKRKANDPLIKDDEVRKVLSALGDRLETSEAETAKLTKQLGDRDARERRDEALKLAKSLSDLGLTPDDHADTLQKWQEADPKGFKVAIEKLEAAGAQLKASELFKEVGSNPPSSGSAEAELEALALEVHKAKPDITIEAARAEVTKSNVALYDRIVKEENERKRKV